MVHKHAHGAAYKDSGRKSQLVHLKHPRTRLNHLRKLQKYLIVFRLREVLLQHRYMGEERGVVKIFGLLGTPADTGLTLDAGTRHFRRVSGINGPHRAVANTGAAAVTAA